MILPATVRLFLALWPAPAVRDALAARQAGWSWPPGAALVAPARLHVTLHFLGAVPVERAGEFRDALAVPCEPFELRLEHAREKVWPGGIAVAEFEAPPPLHRLHERLGTALAALGWPVEERRYRPHVTFARRASGAQPPGQAMHSMRWDADESYVLVRSTPGRGYEVLHRYS